MSLPAAIVLTVLFLAIPFALLKLAKWRSQSLEDEGEEVSDGDWPFVPKGRR